MDAREYFGGWSMFMDMDDLDKAIGAIRKIGKPICPSMDKVFRAFRLCPYRECRIVMLAQDPYPQKGVSTGIPFGNKEGTSVDDMSPSLQVLRESVIDFGIPHKFITFDPTLEEWARQGILMLNSALTCEMNRVGSHSMIWRPFMSGFLNRLSRRTTGLVFVLIGSQAKTFRPYIDARYHDILECEHPSWYARRREPMPRTVFNDIDRIIKLRYNDKIHWYYEND